jgi:hypothetical protein
MKLRGDETIAATLPLVISKRNYDVKRGNVRGRNVPFMARDERWHDCKGTWDRLKWARLQKFSTAEDAAPALGEKPGTYRTYERSPTSSKHTPLDHQKAMHFAKRLGIRWEWLLLGDGAPWRAEDERLDKILIAYEEAPEERKGAVAEAIERLLKTG